MSQPRAVVGWRSWGSPGYPFHPTLQLQESPDSTGGGKEQNLIKVLLGEGLGCCGEPGAALGQAAFRISFLVANTTEVFST